MLVVCIGKRYAQLVTVEVSVFIEFAATFYPFHPLGIHVINVLPPLSRLLWLTTSFPQLM
jgi:hypothetical protein